MARGLERLRRDLRGAASLGFLLLLFALSLLAPVIAPFSPTAQDVNNVLLEPSARNLLGTDDLGRDVFSRLIWGAPATLYASFLAVSVAMVGIGSAVFHPEATRMARHAAAGHQGFAQGIFQIGGHVGYASGPLLAAMIIVPRGQASLAWMSVVALSAMVLMAWTGARYVAMRSAQIAETRTQQAAGAVAPALAGGPILTAMAVLVVLLLSKGAYSAAFTS